MESYQKVGVIVSGIGLLFVLLVPFSIAIGLMLLVGTVSFGGLILSLINVKHHRGAGIAMIVLGVFGNLLLIIPGIMALRYKPESKSEIKPQSKEEGTPSS